MPEPTGPPMPTRRVGLSWFSLGLDGGFGFQATAAAAAGATGRQDGFVDEIGQTWPDQASLGWGRTARRPDSRAAVRAHQLVSGGLMGHHDAFGDQRR